MRKKQNAIALLDRYIIAQFIPTLIFSLAICTILSELIGISFEQVKFVATEGLPMDIAAQIHYLKLPAFLSLSLPLSVLMATIITYGKLSATNEIIALQSYGVSLYRLITSTIAIALILTMLMFALNEVIVPGANYQAAMVLEQEWQVDRTQLAKYNKREIIYQKFTEHTKKSRLKFLFFADRFNGMNMENITLLRYQNSQLAEIITAKTAKWDEQKKSWQLLNGHQDIIGNSSFYIQSKDFEQLWLKLTKDILNYANHHRDFREMNILELYQRLNIINNTNNQKLIRQLKITIQERYALPSSCIVFAFLGAILGITTGRKAKSSSLAIAAISIFIYYAIQFISTTLTTSGFLPVVSGVWLPNLSGLLLGILIILFF